MDSLWRKDAKVVLKKLLAFKMTSYHETMVRGEQTPIHARGEHTALVCPVVLAGGYLE